MLNHSFLPKISQQWVRFDQKINRNSKITFSLKSEMQRFLKLQFCQFAIAQKAKFDAKSFIFAQNKSTMGSF